MRTFIPLAVRGIGLLQKRHIPIQFFATESEARAWLALRRVQLTAVR